VTAQALTVDGRLCCHLGWRPASQWFGELICRWTEADSPWQLLAVCMDIAAALRSGDPATYCSRLPVHQDGSCNGLQHYAALGRDAWGGSAVNLTPNEGHQVSFRRDITHGLIHSHLNSALC
jgi:DNA-dependent RNA polymerase